MSQREQVRARVLYLVLEGRCPLRRAAELLGLGERQVRRLKQRYRSEGVRAVIHRNSGRTPAHAVPPEVKQRLLAVARDVAYAGYLALHNGRCTVAPADNADAHRTLAP